MSIYSVIEIKKLMFTIYPVGFKFGGCYESKGTNAVWARIRDLQQTLLHPRLIFKDACLSAFEADIFLSLYFGLFGSNPPPKLGEYQLFIHY